MVITAWILLVVFGLIGLKIMFKFLVGGSLNIPTGMAGFVSVIIAALSAGVIWGGLFH